MTSNELRISCLTTPRRAALIGAGSIVVMAGLGMTNFWSAWIYATTGTSVQRAVLDQKSQPAIVSQGVEHALDAAAPDAQAAADDRMRLMQVGVWVGTLITLVGSGVLIRQATHPWRLARSARPAPSAGI